MWGWKDQVLKLCKKKWKSYVTGSNKCTGKFLGGVSLRCLRCRPPDSSYRVHKDEQRAVSWREAECGNFANFRLLNLCSCFSHNQWKVWRKIGVWSPLGTLIEWKFSHHVRGCSDYRDDSSLSCYGKYFFHEAIPRAWYKFTVASLTSHCWMATMNLLLIWWQMNTDFQHWTWLVNE